METEEVKRLLSERTSLRTYYKGISVTSIQEAVRSETPLLREVGDQGVNFLKCALQDVVNNVSFTGDINYLTRVIISRYSHLRLAEIKYCFECGIAGEYDKIYGTVYTHTVLYWLQEYNALSSEIRYWMKVK